jgi:phosphate starvation-inducible PhoH-like protein
MTAWLGGAIPVLKERLGKPMLDLAITKQDIEFVPLETVKGMSLNDAWLIVEESSDLTKQEVIKIVTRMGRNSKLVLSGDIRQSELRGNSGLTWLTDFLQRHDHLSKNFGYIDFDSTSDIVRSGAVRDFIIGVLTDEESGVNYG